MICASLTEKTVAGMLKSAANSKADMIEVRLDFLDKMEGLTSLSKIKKPLIVTCMPKKEGGRFNGTEKERIKLLESALSFADYVTVELRTNPSLRDGLILKSRKRKVKSIVAFHDFKKTPSKKKIVEIIKKELKLGDIAKVAFMPKNQDDVLLLLNILMEKNPRQKVIALSMGELGKVTRILGPLLGSYLTYASVPGSKSAGPGQLSVDDLRRVISRLR